MELTKEDWAKQANFALNNFDKLNWTDIINQVNEWLDLGYETGGRCIISPDYKVSMNYVYNGVEGDRGNRRLIVPRGTVKYGPIQFHTHPSRSKSDFSERKASMSDFSRGKASKPYPSYVDLYNCIRNSIERKSCMHVIFGRDRVGGTSAFIMYIRCNGDEKKIDALEKIRQIDRYMRDNDCSYIDAIKNYFNVRIIGDLSHYANKKHYFVREKSRFESLGIIDKRETKNKNNNSCIPFIIFIILSVGIVYNKFRN
jgi:hypothetical protein